MTLEELRKMQLLQMDILALVHNICRENKLKYYLISGTLLGSIRHNGFIPWDLDSDIAMYRDDYERFLQIAPSIMPSEYALQYTAIDKNCVIPFARILLNNAQIIKSSGQISKVHLDIFILDYVEKDNKIIGKLKENLVLFLAYIRSYRTNKWRLEGKNAWWKNAIIRFGNAITWFLKGEDFDNLLKRIVCYKEYKTDYTTVASSRYGYVKGTFRSEWFRDTIEVDFEGKKLLAPIDYDKILKKMYGDYMAPPPEDRRFPVYFNSSKVIFGEFNGVQVYE